MHRGLRFSIALALGLLQAGCIAVGGRWSHMEGSFLFSDERPVVQVVTTSAGGKNFFVPSTIVVTAGSGRRLSLYNTTDAPHGFQIPSLGVELILQPGVETPLDLPPLEAGHIYAINCHLHPPHRGASLVVLPSAPE
jgi:heme/copper-type cytochrome/quinol oxidase subunit 2